MVFIDKIKDIVKLFENSSREEIGIALLAYEEFICKDLKVTDEDLSNLTEVFNYYDKRLSDEFPSLTNEALQNSNDLICNCFGRFEKDGYNIRITYDKRTSDSTCFDVSIIEKDTGNYVDEIDYTISDKYINCDYYKNPFNTTVKACQEVKNKVKNISMEELLKSFKF